MSLPPSEAPFRSAAVRPSGGDRRALILVVERNPVVQRLERFFLEQAGFTVEHSLTITSQGVVTEPLGN